MRMSLQIDPHAIAKKRRLYDATRRPHYERSAKQMRRVNQKWHQNNPLYQRMRHREKHLERWLAESKKRERTFHTINDARERGLPWKEIRKLVKTEPYAFMREAKRTWEWGNMDGRDWAARTDPDLVAAIYNFMTCDDADFEDMEDVLIVDTEYALLNPDAIYQDGWYNGVCQFYSPGYVVRSRFEQKQCQRKCVICGNAFKGERGVKTCSPACAKENRRRYVNGYARASTRSKAKQRTCVVCGNSFKPERAAKTCSLKCSRENKRRHSIAAKRRWRAKQKSLGRRGYVSSTCATKSGMRRHKSPRYRRKTDSRLQTR